MKRKKEEKREKEGEKRGGVDREFHTRTFSIHSSTMAPSQRARSHEREEKKIGGGAGQLFLSISNFIMEASWRDYLEKNVARGKGG